ncbi:MAG: hypothetical protein DPW12_11855 [Rhodocyclaceae bacterium]|nr:hypothetical protein [Rhodocyclaceae bacterium]
MRAARRAGSGTASPPPAHQDTRAPSAAHTDTAATADQRHAPAPRGPKAANTESRDGARQPRATASAPRQHPTDTAAGDTAASANDTTDAPPGGKQREPATAHINTPW